jgi:beta-lactamase superfamily II metal-dependent hydrolase
MFTIEMLPAERGDCLWITYGETGDLHHIVIDGGPLETIQALVPDLERRIKAVPGGANRIELLVVTHIDADHIQGVVSLLSQPSRLTVFRDIWFNGWRHVSETLGAPDGERLGALLDGQSRWNKAFDGGPVVVPDASVAAGLPVKKLAGGMTLTLLSPNSDGLAAIAKAWVKEATAAGLVPGHGAEIPKSWKRSEILGFDPDVLAATKYRRDPSPANFSSIAFIASYKNRHVLFGADAHAEVIEQSLARLGTGPHRFNAVKAAHHGSKGNHTMSMLGQVTAKRWLISTNGAKFHHPDAAALARIVATQTKPTFYFNYVSDEPQLADVIDAAGTRYSVKLPKKRPDGTYDSGIVVSL